jgi:hypothetical protein
MIKHESEVSRKMGPTLIIREVLEIPTERSVDCISEKNTVKSEDGRLKR